MRPLMTRAFLLAAAVLTIQAGAGAATEPPPQPSQPAPPAPEPRSVTLPFALDHNRMTVEVELSRPDGTIRKALAWVDTGTESLILAEPLAGELGIDIPALPQGGGAHSVESRSPAPLVRLGGLTLDSTRTPLRVSPGDHVMLGVSAEVHLPASVLRHLHVVFDYPASRLTAAKPGSLKPRGVPVPCRVNRETGLLLVDTTFDGETVRLGVDNGSAGTWVSDLVTARLKTRHPEWPVTIGAVGSANFFGFGFEAAGTLMRLPELGVGSLKICDIALLGLDQRLFNWYSQKSAGTVAGFLGGNVLKRFRLEVDWPDQMTYWEAGPRSDDRDLDIVGLTLRPEPDGSYTVAGVVAQGGRATVDGVQTGDRLIRVGSLEVIGAQMGKVEDALRGSPGDTRTLVLDRQGRRVTVEARVTRFP